MWRRYRCCSKQPSRSAIAPHSPRRMCRRTFRYRQVIERRQSTHIAIPSHAVRGPFHSAGLSSGRADSSPTLRSGCGPALPNERPTAANPHVYLAVETLSDHVICPRRVLGRCLQSEHSALEKMTYCFSRCRGADPHGRVGQDWEMPSTNGSRDIEVLTQLCVAVDTGDAAALALSYTTTSSTSSCLKRPTAAATLCCRRCSAT